MSACLVLHRPFCCQNPQNYGGDTSCVFSPCVEGIVETKRFVDKIFILYGLNVQLGCLLPLQSVAMIVSDKAEVMLLGVEALFHIGW